MEKKICHECGTENEQDFLYCKNCGADLRKAEEGSQYTGAQYTPPNYNNYNYNSQAGINNSFMIDSVDGVPMEQIGLYVGKKADYYCRKFSKMELTKGKASWNWPVAVLGFLFGPLGSALWCFYRKMYKTALILVAAGLLLTASLAVLTYDANAAAFDGILKATQYETVEEIIAALENIETVDTVSTNIADNIETNVGLITGVIMGIFANWFYKCSCVEKIKKYQTSGLDQRYYKLGLSAVGGTSGGMLAVGIIIMLAIENTASIVTFITYLMNR